MTDEGAAEVPVSMNPADYESPPPIDKPYFFVVGMDPKEPDKGLPFAFNAVNEQGAVATATAIAVLLKAQWFSLWDARTRRFVSHVRCMGDAMALGARINEIMKAMVTPALKIATEGMERKFQEFNEKRKARRPGGEGL